MDPDHADILVVGAGPAGSVVSHTLASRGLSVTCLEQGDWINPEDFPGGKPEFELLIKGAWAWDPNVRKLPQDYPLNVDRCDLPPIMLAAVGGSSVVYGAQWQRLMPSDFRVRTLDGVCDDWPIAYEDLAPFYNIVDGFLGISGLRGDPAYPDFDVPMPPLPMGPAGMRMAAGMNRLGWHWWPGTNAIPSWPYKNMAQCVGWGVCERGCPAGAKASFDVGYWPHATRAGAQLITGARVARITVDGRGYANGAIWFARDGTEHHMSSNSVVLAANGIGTPRILLMSDDQRPGGLANSSGLVGKNLMIHPNSVVAGLYDEEIQSWKGPAGQLMYSLEFYETDLSRGFYRGSKWCLMPIPGVLSVLEMFRNHPFAHRWGRQAHKLSNYAGRALTWFCIVDDLPKETNRVTLDDSLTDSSGLPAPRVTYRFSENTQRNLHFSADRAVESHEAAGAAHIFVLPVGPSGHLMGTARMGNDPETSVVDRFGRSHDVPNLFIVDGSVMVTGGSMNPTASIAALALRTATHIAETARLERVPA